MNTGIEVTTRFFPLAFLLFFVKPRIEINGKSFDRKWGTSSFELPAGEYRVKISFPYIMRECGANEVLVRISEGGTAKIDYFMPPWMFSKGRIRVA